MCMLLLTSFVCMLSYLIVHLLSLLVFACYPLCHPPCVCMLPSVIYLVFACYPLGLCLHATLFLVTVGIHLKWSLLGLCNSRDVLLKIGFHIEIVLTCASPRKKCAPTASCISKISRLHPSPTMLRNQPLECFSCFFWIS